MLLYGKDETGDERETVLTTFGSLVGAKTACFFYVVGLAESGADILHANYPTQKTFVAKEFQGSRLTVYNCL